MTMLQAAETILIVDADAGQRSAQTDITYDGEGLEVRLVRRISGGPWREIDLAAATGASTPDAQELAWRRGSFKTPFIAPGAILQIGALPSNISLDPNADGFSLGRFDALVTIYALLKSDGEQGWVSDQNQMTGGTCHLRTIATGSRPTVMRVEVGDKPPIRPSGPWRFEKPLKVIDDTRFATVHQFEPTFLLAGHRHFITFLMIDAAGKWSSFTDEFTTLKRLATINFAWFTVHNDSDADTWLTGSDKGEIAVDFEVYEGERNRVNAFSWGRGDVSDKWPSNFVPLTGLTHTMGPAVVTPQTLNIGVAVRATEDDDFGTDHAQSMPSMHGTRSRLFFLPSGIITETVARIETIHAVPASDGSSLHLSVAVQVTVTYV